MLRVHRECPPNTHLGGWYAVHISYCEFSLIGDPHQGHVPTSNLEWVFLHNCELFQRGFRKPNSRIQAFKHSSTLVTFVPAPAATRVAREGSLTIHGLLRSTGVIASKIPSQTCRVRKSSSVYESSLLVVHLHADSKRLFSDVIGTVDVMFAPARMTCGSVSKAAGVACVITLIHPRRSTRFAFCTLHPRSDTRPANLRQVSQGWILGSRGGSTAFLDQAARTKRLSVLVH